MRKVRAVRRPEEEAVAHRRLDAEVLRAVGPGHGLPVAMLQLHDDFPYAVQTDADDGSRCENLRRHRMKFATSIRELHAPAIRGIEERVQCAAHRHAFSRDERRAHQVGFVAEAVRQRCDLD